MIDSTESATLAAVREHLAAFNAHSTARLLAGFTDDAVWVTGQDVTRGRDGLAELFDDWLWSLDPSLTVRTLITDGPHAAAELVEEFTVDGEPRRENIAVFFRIDGGLISSAKVYREGSADID